MGRAEATSGRVVQGVMRAAVSCHIEGSAKARVRHESARQSPPLPDGERWVVAFGEDRVRGHDLSAKFRCCPLTLSLSPPGRGNLRSWPPVNRTARHKAGHDE